jgi:serine-type D-Ala-D-Ala carboxypeptidase (penicillin-binding protein 5/6)
LYVVGVNRPVRPPLYGLEVGRRRRRRRLPVLRLPPLAAVALVLLAVIAAGSAFVAYRLWPLTDRGAGVIGPPVPAAHRAHGTTPPASLPLRPLNAPRESRVHIPGVQASSGVLTDSASGSVLWGHEAHRPLPIASLTKLMTALVALPEPARLDRAFAVTPAMVGVPGYTISLHAGQVVTPRKMLAAALIASANDAANALAVHAAGSLRKFVARMNVVAGRLGLSDTHYSNPSGSFDRGNHSSAWDVADLSRHVLDRPLLRRLVGRRAYQSGNDLFVSRNRLLWSYHGAIGVKTGSTTAAGNCLAVAATRHGHTLVAVLLHVRGDEFKAAAKLLDWGFKHDR